MKNINDIPVKELQKWYKNSNLEQKKLLLEDLSQDNRSGVQKIVIRIRKEIDFDMRERKRLQEMYQYEQKAYDMGARLVFGIDEAGRGPLMGPVVATAVSLPKDCVLMGLDDSKKLSESRRNSLYDEIYQKAIYVGVGVSTQDRIDEINILNATKEAMYMSIKNAFEYGLHRLDFIDGKLENISVKRNIYYDISNELINSDYGTQYFNEKLFLLIDAVKLTDIDIRQMSIIKGDQKSASIAAASIIAKVTRDRWVYEQAKMYPQYDFENNKGYGTKSHRDALKKFGASSLHRKSFIKNLF